ncbi:MAG: hypothetical protein GWP08_09525 [Nitrospiraceae bacterium]|nr:hypothetical protein [Nitrospiraceae bacterium]
MLAETASFLTWIYTPAMWACVAVNVLMGLAGLLAPGWLRATVAAFTSTGPVRILGAVAMILGTGMFMSADGTASPLLVKTLGVVLFVDGGVGLVIPTLHIILSEWVVGWKNPWYRLFGLTAFGMAYVFYLATMLPAPPAAI